jgi:uncharacterized protein (DUF305 family)
MWIKLVVMTIVSFIAMYLLMYTMVDKFSDVFFSIGQIYMAGSMTAAMVAIELVIMRAMYKNAFIRNILIGVSIVALILCVAFTRYQTAIGNEGFLRSMIPHHSGAILMCERADITDSDIRKLCSSIIQGQQSEIDLMKAKLAEIK